MEARRTSRKPVQVGRWTKRAKRAKQIERSVRRNGTTRKGRLRHKHVRATEYKGRDPVFKGRIAVDRGSGVLEFPDYEQFERLARSEKVPKEKVRKAFGHMDPAPPRRTTRTRRRRTSRRKSSKSRRTSKKKKRRRVTRNARRKAVRRDEVFAPHTRDGEEVPLRAQTVLIPQTQVGSFGAHRGVWMSAEGQTIILPYERAFQIAERWLTKKDFNKAFGHLRPRGVLGETERRRPVPTAYGTRPMRLGHRMPPGEGPARPGIVEGQLILYHKPSGSIVWQAYDDEVNFPQKPIWIWFGASKGHFDFPKAMQGAKVGRGDRAEFVGAVDRNIPPMAMLQAFGHLLTPEQRREAYQVFARH